MHEEHVVVGQKIQGEQKPTKGHSQDKSREFHSIPLHVFFLGFCFYDVTMISSIFDISIQSNPMSHVDSSSTSSNPRHETNCMISRSLTLVISDCIA